jgi:hypothetical protein
MPINQATVRRVLHSLSHETPTVALRLREHVEWTPASLPPLPGEHSRSNWPTNPTLGLLTNRKIDSYAREGRYGPAAKRFALARQHKLMVTRLGVVIRCPCGNEAVAFMRYGYLPQAGYYCGICREVHRSNAEKQKGQQKRWLERVSQEYV